MTVRKFYKGFSTRGYENQGTHFDVYNVECVEQDLLNAIFTVRGDRVMMPTFGTRIPLLIFEINDSETQQIIKDDLMTVFNGDPRVKVLNLDVIPVVEKNALIAVAKIQYLEFQVTRDLMIEINSR